MDNFSLLVAQILAATAAKPVMLQAGTIARTPGAYLMAYTTKGTVYVKAHGLTSINPGPFAVPRAKTVLKAGTAVRIIQLHSWPESLLDYVRIRGLGNGKFKGARVRVQLQS